MPIFIPGGGKIYGMPAGFGGNASIPVAASLNFAGIVNVTGFVFTAWFFIPFPVASLAANDSAVLSAGPSSNLPNMDLTSYGLYAAEPATLIFGVCQSANFGLSRNGGGYNVYVANNDVWYNLYCAASPVDATFGWPAFSCTGGFVAVQSEITFNYQCIAVTQ